MQLRTSQRISELQDELKQLDDEDYSDQIALLEEQANELDFDIDEGKQAVQAASENVQKQHAEVQAIEAKRRDALGQLQTAQSTKSALEALQQDASNFEGTLLEGIEKLWQQISSSQKLAPCIEAILQHARDPVVAKNYPVQELLKNESASAHGVKVYTENLFVSSAKAGSLAHALLTELAVATLHRHRFPHFLMIFTSVKTMKILQIRWND